jgi:hypothetical protein
MTQTEETGANLCHEMTLIYQYSKKPNRAEDAKDTFSRSINTGESRLISGLGSIDAEYVRGMLMDAE